MTQNTIDKLQTAKLPERSIYWMILLLFLAVCLLTYVIQSNMCDDPRMSLEGLVYGTAHRPFVMRALLPQLSGMITPLISGGLVDAAHANPVISQAMDELSRAYPVEAVATLLVMFGSLVLFAWSLRGLMREIGFTPFWIAAAPFLIVPMIVILFTPAAIIYDPAILALFTLALWLILRDQFGAYLVILGLANIAKETAVLLPLVYLVHHYPQINWRRVAEQVFVVIVIRLLIVFAFANNPGGVVEFNWRDHLEDLQSETFVYIAQYVMIGVILFGAFWRWKLKPPYLVKAAVVVMPVLTALHFVLGTPGELRVFAEIFPVLILLLVYPYYKRVDLKETILDWIERLPEEDQEEIEGYIKSRVKRD